MPELPEVETIARGLHARLAGERIRDCVLNRPDMRFAFPADLQEVLISAYVKAVRRRAKYLLFDLDNHYTVLAHLGMSGTMRVMPAADYAARKHDHVLWELENDHFFVFHDPRRFGFMLLSPTDRLGIDPLLSELGPEPLENDFNADYLARILQKRQSAVKVALMDQKAVVGVGNIYASEALFRAEISPFLPSREAAKHTSTLVAAIQAVLREAIASGGSTLRDYIRSDGDSGYFQHDFAVYGRAGKPCPRCHAPVEKARQAGRATYFCINCQKVSGDMPRQETIKSI